MGALPKVELHCHIEGALRPETVIDGAEHAVVHREAFFTPARHLANGQELADMDRAFGLAEFVEPVSGRPPRR